MYEELLPVIRLLLFLVLLLACVVGAVALAVHRRSVRSGDRMFQTEEEWRAAMEKQAAALLDRALRKARGLLRVRRGGEETLAREQREMAKLLLAAGLYEDRAPALFQAGRAYIAALLTEEGAWRRPPVCAGDALLAYAVLTYPGTDPAVVRPAMEQTAMLLQALGEESGTVPADADRPRIRLAQTVADICPFLTAYANAYGEPFYCNLAMRQIDEYLRMGLHPFASLPAEGFDGDSGLPIGAFGWSGACEALAFGLMETGRHLPAEDARSVSLAVHSRLLAQQLCALWGENSCFPRLPSSGAVDTEASAMIAVFLQDAYQGVQEGRPPACIRSVKKELLRRTKQNGCVGAAQPPNQAFGIYSEEEIQTVGALAAALYAAAKLEQRQNVPDNKRGKKGGD